MGETDMKKVGQRSVVSALAVGAALLAPGLASAQQQSVSDAASGGEGQGASATESPEAGDIVVTALKREQSIQRIPAAVSAINSEMIREAGITDVTNLQFYVPSLVAGKLGGVTAVSIRGVGLNQYGPTAQPGVAIHIDGVYQARTLTGGLGQIDLERVEVLRGPQGTLYGRNATGGAVNFITADPTDILSAQFLVGYASYDEYHLQGIFNIPVSEGLRARLTVDYNDRNRGFIKNVVPGSPDADKGSTLTARFKVAADISSNLSLNFSAFYMRRQGGFPYLLLNAAPDPSAVAAFPALGTAIVSDRPWRFSADLAPTSNLETYGGAATATLVLGSVKFKSITAASHYRYRDQFDSDGTNLPIITLLERVHSKTFSQELNLTGDAGPLDWLVGAFYMNDTISDTPARFVFPIGYPLVGIVPGGAVTSNSRPYRVKTIAVFTDNVINVNDKFRLIVGARYTADKVTVRSSNVIEGLEVAPGFVLPATDFCSGNVVDAKFKAFTPKVGLQYDFTSRVNAYATVSRGFKDGGVNGCDSVYQPEKITAYEAGLRARLFDGAVTLNPTAFYYDYADFQVTQFQGLAAPVINAPKASVKGFEVEAAWAVSPHLSINATGTLLDATFGKGFSNTDTLNIAAGPQDLAGKRLNRSPKRSGSLGVQYRTPLSNYGQFSLRGDVYLSSRIYFREFNSTLDSQDAYSVVNVNLTWTSPSERYQARLYVTNLGNSGYFAQLGASDAFASRFAAYAPPRQVGIELRASY
jgi:iron complex outermembrane receptor protein